jgi:hypothetical protein
VPISVLASRSSTLPTTAATTGSPLRTASSSPTRSWSCGRSSGSRLARSIWPASNQTWGDKQSVEIKDDWRLLSEEERRRRAEALIVIIQEIKNPPPDPLPIVYRAEEPEENTGGVGS